MDNFDFSNKVCPKKIFPVQNKTNEHHYRSTFEIVKLLNFLSTDHFDFLENICPERVFLVQNRKSEHQHGIQHIRISLDVNFCLKQTILTFFDEVCSKKVEKSLFILRGDIHMTSTLRGGGGEGLRQK